MALGDDEGARAFADQLIVDLTDTDTEQHAAWTVAITWDGRAVDAVKFELTPASSTSLRFSADH